VFDHTHQLTATDARLWNTTLRQVSPTLLSKRPSVLARAEENRRLARTMLQVFPSTVRPHAEHFQAIPSNRLRAAIEYIEANAHLPITSTDVAAAVGWAPRTLQVAFRRHFGLTPHQCIRDTRLERARIELRASDPRLHSVADIADRWGFPHHGRFSSTYAARFQELPSATLNFP
jgi:AraC-like DNA-binding protein